MKKVVIVDDEKWVLEGLKRLIDWNKYGYSIIGQASNGIEAIQVIQELEPNIVFIDIRMPGKTGLEVMGVIKRCQPLTEFIFISGYAEFDYVQEAINNGAVGYFLKPFSEEVLIDKLQELDEKFMARYKHNEWQLFYQLAIEANDVVIRKLFNQLGMVHARKFGGIYVNESEIIDRQGVICFNITQKYSFWLCEEEVYHNMVAYVENQKIKYGKVPPRDNHFSQLVKDTQNDYLNKNLTLAITKTIETETRLTLMEDIKRAIYFRNHSKLTEVSEYLASFFQHGKASYADLLYFWVSIKQLCSGIKEEKNSLKEENNESYIIEHYKDTKDILDELRQDMEEALGGLHISQDNHKKGIMEEVIKYVHKNYTHEITLQDLAKMFHMHPNYISQLFRKECKEPFSKYLIRLRLDKACDLLIHSNYSIQQIANSSGFKDYFYFAKRFKREKGMTPSDFRLAKKLINKT